MQNNMYQFAWVLAAGVLLAFFSLQQLDAERAYKQAGAVLDASAYDYDIDRAERLYFRALRLDPHRALVRHQLARIAFLKGDFNLALGFINDEIATNLSPTPSSYYVRALIEGFMGDYAASARDYERYLEHDPHNWAALNDYAWVLLKAGRAAEALAPLERGLAFFPENPWLLNSYAIALHEEGRDREALHIAQQALRAVQNVTEEEWIRAYPGNDPNIARDGIIALQESARVNLRAIRAVQ